MVEQEKNFTYGKADWEIIKKDFNSSMKRGMNKYNLKDDIELEKGKNKDSTFENNDIDNKPDNPQRCKTFKINLSDNDRINKTYYRKDKSRNCQ